VEARNRLLPDWFTQIRTGQIKLPRFQRYESWSHSNITNLLESVVQGLPAGAALVLRVGDHEKFISREVVGAPTVAAQPTEHLLDGQQRLTALWRSLHDNYEDRTYFVYFENGGEDTRPRIYGQPRWKTQDGRMRPAWADAPKGINDRGYIPLRLLRPDETGQNVRAWCRAATAEPEGSERLEDRINELRQRVLTYNIPFLELPATTPKDVALDVFINMNTSYVRLTSFDIIVAQFEEATGESLHDLVTQLNERVPVLALYMEPSDLVLEVAALREDKPPTQVSYQQLGLERLFNEWQQVIGGVAQAVEFLEEEHVYDAERLPTVAVIRVLAALSEHIPTSPDKLGNARSLLRKYLWRASLTARYEAAAATASFQDFRGLRDALGGLDTPIPLFDEARYPVPTGDSLLNARWPKGRDTLARGILNVTIRAGADDIADGTPASRGQLAKREYHHLFPASLLERDGQLTSREIYRALNCALISWRTNRTIAAKPPIAYLRERIDGADLGMEEIARRLATHYVPFGELNAGGYDKLGDPTRRGDQLRTDYEAFLRARADLLLPAISALCDGREP